MATVQISKAGRVVARRPLDERAASQSCEVGIDGVGRAVVSRGGPVKIGDYEVAIDDQPAVFPDTTTDSQDDDPPTITVKGLPAAAPAASEGATPAETLAGPEIEGYRIIGRLGEGGMGVVWRAVQLSTHREVALKLLGVERFGSRQARARFEREVELAAKLEHPNIARVYDSGLHHGICYYAMELVDGLPLDAHIERYRLSRRQLLELMRDICVAVQHAHKQSVIHRDLKPSNILVDRNGQPHILDFGLAKIVSGGADTALVTIQDELVGTPAFMSPEQAAGRVANLDPRTDVYSLGVMLFRLLTGHWPHDVSGTTYDIVRRVREEDVPLPRDFNRQVDRELEAVVLKALSRNREPRYTCAGDLGEDIGNYLAGEPLKARKPTRLYRLAKWIRRNRTAVAISAAAPMVLVGVLVLHVPVAMGFLSLLTLVAASVYAYVQSAQEQRRAMLAKAEAERQRLRAEYEARRAEQEAEHARREAEARRRDLYASHVGQAGMELERGNIGRTRELLASCPEDLRGPEWHLLDNLQDQSRAVLLGHTLPVTSVKFSPDGSRIVSGSRDKTIRIWDTATARELLVVQGHTAHVLSVAYSPDGTRIASGSADRTARIWDAATGAEIKCFDGHPDRVTCVDFSPDGDRLAIACADSTCRVVNVTDGQEMFRATHSRIPLSEDRGPAYRAAMRTLLAFSPDGQALVSGGWDGMVRIWDVRTGSERKAWQSHADIIYLALTRGGREILSIGAPAFEPKLWDVGTGVLIRTIPKTDACGSILGSSALPVYGGTSLSIEGNKGRVILNGHTRVVIAADLSPDGRLAVSGSEDCSLRLWDVARKTHQVSACDHEGDEVLVHAVTFSPDGRQFACGCFNDTGTLRGAGMVKVWDASTGQILQSLRAHVGRIRQVAFSPDGARIASAGEDGLLNVSDCQTGKAVLRIEADSKYVRSVVYGRGGQCIISGGGDPTVKVWDANTGRLRSQLAGLSGRVMAVATTREGSRIGATDDHGTARIWNAASGQPELTVTDKVGSSGLAFDPAGQWFVIFGDGLNRRSALTGELQGAFRTSAIQLMSAVVSHDGSRIATVDARRFSIWDALTGAHLLSFAGHQNRMMSITFCPDGKSIVTGGDDGMIRIWDISPRR